MVAVIRSISGVIMFLLTRVQAVSNPWIDPLINLHDLGAFIIITFILAHLSALALHDVIERRGLISSMISGYKFFREEDLKELHIDIKPEIRSGD